MLELKMPLFDRFLRTETRPRRQNEGSYEYMNVSARPGICAIRELLEMWFEHLSADAQADVRGRIRSRDEAQHQSAFFELYWHELLRCSDFEVETHPQVPNVASNPDFLAHRDGEPQFYLEATLAMPPGDPAADRRFAELHDTLDRMNSPDYFLDIKYRGNPQANIRGRLIRQRLERWLRELDHNDISRLYREHAYGALPKLTWTEQGCVLTFTPIPKGPQLRGRIGPRPVGTVMPMQMGVVCTDEDICAAIDGKATKYGDLDRPLIVAVNVLDDFCEDADILNALFGQEQVVETCQADGQLRTEWDRRAENGAWRGRTGPRNTLVGGVSVTHQLSPSTLRSRSVGIIHNPWTVNPLALGTLSIPQITISVPDGQLHRHDGTHHADLLGIPAQWPVQD